MLVEFAAPATRARLRAAGLNQLEEEGMFGRTRTDKVKDNASAAADLAAALAKDKKFRKQLLGATQHGYRARGYRGVCRYA